VTQMAAVIVLEAIFEADLTDEQYAYRRKRSTHDSARKVHELLKRKYAEVVDADLKRTSTPFHTIS
jgi:RNA-directed DNA polymerase